MMEFTYYKPHADVRQAVSSYYDVRIPSEVNDMMRAEIANIRIILSGSCEWELGGERHRFTPGDAILCGPTFAASSIRFAQGTHVFGMAVTPLGWARMFKVGADQMADRIVPLRTLVSPSAVPALETMLQTSDCDRIQAADTFFSAMLGDTLSLPHAALEVIADWLADPEPNELSDLLAKTDLSHRQIDRLCRTYFGASPKRLHRKFRALHAANRLTWKDLTDWRDIARTSYYDQSHFIREFKAFNGRTPSEFIQGMHILVRITLKERLQIAHESPFSLIG